MSAVQYKIMPNSLDMDFNWLRKESEKIIVDKGGIIANFEELPIAFGLKALIISFAYPEEKDVDQIGNDLSALEGVTSADMIDYRRAFG